MRGTRSGSIQHAVARAYRAAGGVEAVAELLGLANSTVSYGTEINEHRPGGIGVNYLDRIGRAHPQGAEAIAQHFCGLAGGVFEPVLSGDNVTCLWSAAGDAAKECGEAQAAMVRAAHQATAGNADSASREIDEAVECLLRFKAGLRAKAVGG